MDALCGRPGMRDDQAGTPEPQQSKTQHRVYGEHDVAMAPFRSALVGPPLFC
jgi:hypothetical protein